MEQQWNGFSMEIRNFEGKEAVVVFPRTDTSIGRMAVKTEYWGAFPEAVEIALLEAGFHLCYVANDNRWGADRDLDRISRFTQSVAKECGLSEKVVPVGMSCGGLIAIKLAAKYPDLISCLYLDAPVLNYMSCPCGFGIGRPLGDDCIAEILNALGMNSISQLICYRDMPMDRISNLIQHSIPVVMVAGDSDQFVPYQENGLLLQQAYENSNVDFLVHVKPGCDHHPHGLADNREVIHFILSH